MKLDHLQSLNSRLEIKFVFSDLEYLSALEIIDDLPMLTRAYSDRTISSVYFDTLEGGYAKDNLIGLSNRLKLRFRYYNNNYTIGFFETKLKKNKVGTKKTIKSI